MQSLSPRLLSIGAFSAATQISPKALRLYDEQQLLAPSHVDAANGYRYYRSEQIASGRLIRTLRDMGLPLTDIASVVHAPSTRAEFLLGEYAKELERLRARERHAHQSALLLLRHRSPSESLAIETSQRLAMRVAVKRFVATRWTVFESFQSELKSLADMLGTKIFRQPLCALVDPLTDEPGQLEALARLDEGALPSNVPTRTLCAAPCAIVRFDGRTTHANNLTGAIDAVFDWFDREGVDPLDVPLLSVDTAEAHPRIELMWAYSKPAGRMP